MALSIWILVSVVHLLFNLILTKLPLFGPLRNITHLRPELYGKNKLLLVLKDNKYIENKCLHLPVATENLYSSPLPFKHPSRNAYLV